MANAALDALIARIKESKGTMASVNPPSVATRILEEETRPEVERAEASAATPLTAASEPPAADAAQTAATAAAGEPAAGAKRRTAAVVQAELDLALKELAAAGEQIAALKAGAGPRAPVGGIEAAPLEALVAELKRRGLGVFSLGGS